VSQEHLQAPDPGSEDESSRQDWSVGTDVELPSDEAIKGRLGEKTLLVVSHQYDLFAKAQIDELATLFDEIHVYVRYNRIGDLGRFIDLDLLRGYGKRDKIVSESPANVHIYPTPVTYLPIDPWYRRLGEHHYASVSRRLSGTETEFDLVHAHFTWSAGYVGAKLGEELDIPSVLTIHENQDWLTRELSWDNERLEWALRTHDAIIRVNEKDCERLATYNDRVYAIPNGFDPDRFPQQPTTAARRKLALPADAAVVFSVGNLNARKRFDRLIEAVSEVSLDRQIICAVGGQGEQQDHLERVAAEQDGIDARVLGYISDEKLACWMNACDIFSLASEAEGNPTVMFEALGCGKPYVGTNVGGVDEIIISDEYGLYCPPDDMEALTSTIETGLERDWNRDAIRQYAEQFTWNRIAKRVTGVYCRLLPA